MFDIGFSEMIVIAVVALIVIGPERLPTVARTLGHLLGRLQRYVGDVKSDIQREMQLDELKKLQAEVENQARGIERAVVGEMQSVESGLNAQAAALSETMTGPKPEAPQSMLVDFDPKDLPAPSLPADPGLAPAAVAAAPAELPGMAAPAADRQA